MPLLKKMLASLLRIAAGVPVVGLMVGGLLLLLLGATTRGRCVGGCFAILGTVLFCSVGYWRRNWFQKIRLRFYLTLVPLGLLLYVGPMMLAPDGEPTGGRVQNRFLRGERVFSRCSPWNVIPESDQIKVGMHLLSLGVVPYSEAARMRSLVMPIYEEMDRDADFRELGSAMGAVYRDLARVEFRSGHYYLFMPDVGDGQRLPCLIFLHGMGGNIKPCLWLLSKFSSEMKCVVIAPTFGIGNWDNSGGAELVVDVAREAIDTLPIDPKRIFLMGYSNGAMGVTRAAIRDPSLFAGLVYLSPVTEDELFSVKEFLTHTGDRKILFLHGRSDTRIPLGFVEGTVARLKGLGCDVRLKVFDDDHYLIFSQPEPVLDEIIELMGED